MTDTKAPEKIWAWEEEHPATNARGYKAGGWVNTEPVREATPYTPTDIADALVAAAYEAAAEVADQRHQVYMESKGRDPADYTSGYSIARDAIRALTPDDAKAALDRIVQKAVTAERERCAEIVEDEARFYAGLREGTILDRMAAGIRKGGEDD